jgi:hypothetical protein
MDDFAEEERTAVIRLLRNAIDADRYFLSARVKLWKAALAKLDPSSVRPTPEPKPPLSPSRDPTVATGEGGDSHADARLHRRD